MNTQQQKEYFAQLAANGSFTTKLPSQFKSNRKSLFGVRPSMNKGSRRPAAKLGQANMNTTPGACQG